MTHAPRRVSGRAGAAEIGICIEDMIGCARARLPNLHCTTAKALIREIRISFDRLMNASSPVLPYAQLTPSRFSD